MKRLVVIISACLLLSGLAVRAEGAETPRLLIVELQTGSAASASEEFIELYNAGTQPLALEGWQLQYRSATGANWSNKAALTGALMPRSRLLLASNNYLVGVASQHFGSGFAKSGGAVRVVLVGEAETEGDKVGWGTPNEFEGQAVSAPADGSSLKRRVDEDGYFVDTNTNQADFTASATPTPASDPAFTIENPDEPTDAEPEPDTEPPVNPGPTTTPPPASTSYAKVQISELMVDPVKPLTDAEAEFVELYNPNGATVNLEGYVLKSGLNNSYRFTLPAVSLGAKQYRVILSADSGLTLSNSGGRVQLFDPSGTLVDSAEPYAKAAPGQSWAKVAGKWQWTTIVTPGKANQSGGVASAGASTSTPSSAGGSARLTQPSSSYGSGTAASAERNTFQEPPVAEEQNIDRLLLAGVGSLAVLYAGYEYRHDIANRLAQARRYLGAWRGRRQAAQGRGTD